MLKSHTDAAAADKHVSYKGDPLPDDVVRVILAYAAEKGITARAVCKTWLNISNSLTSLFLKQMIALQAQNARIKDAAKKIAMERAFRLENDQEEDNMDWAVQVTAMRLANKVPREQTIGMLASFNMPDQGGRTTNELAMTLAEQLHYETDNGTEDEESDQGEESDLDEFLDVDSD